MAEAMNEVLRLKQGPRKLLSVETLHTVTYLDLPPTLQQASLALRVAPLRSILLVEASGLFCELPHPNPQTQA